MMAEQQVEKMRILLRVVSAFGKRLGAPQTSDEVAVREVAAAVAGAAAVLAYRVVKTRRVRLVR